MWAHYSVFMMYKMDNKGDNCRRLSMKWVFMYTAIFDIIKTEQFHVVICLEQELLLSWGAGIG